VVRKHVEKEKRGTRNRGNSALTANGATQNGYHSGKFSERKLKGSGRESRQEWKRLSKKKKKNGSLGFEKGNNTGSSGKLKRKD